MKRWLAPIAAATLLGASGTLLISCKQPPAGDDVSPAEVVLRQYEVRAEITQLPGEDGQRFMARHEAIPDFDGGTQLGMGMDVMTMPFWPPMPGPDKAPDSSRLPETLDLEGLAVGDAVLVTFEVQHASPGGPAACFYALSVEKLPDGTALDFETRLPDTMVFETRARITQLPGTDEFGMTQQLLAQHEAVPDYPNPDGSTGMNVMTMPFWPPATTPDIHEQRLPADLDLEGIAVGDAVLITWEVQIDRASRAPLGYYALSVEKLPDGTELDFTPLAN